MSKCFVNILLAMEESLRIENWTTYTKCQMNNSIENQIYPKIIYKTSLCIDWKYNSFNVVTIYVAAIIRHEKHADMQKN